MTEDRHLLIEPGLKVVTRWIHIDDCVLGCRERMDFAAIERAGRRQLQAGDCQWWPPITGRWLAGRFVVHDGRHELLALMALGHEEVFVAWIEDE